MGVFWKKDSVKEINSRKTNEELQAENELLRQKVAELESELTNTQVALCDVYELVAGGAE